MSTTQIQSRSIQDIIDAGRKSSEAELFAIFDQLEAVDIEFMLGTWKGEEFITGHFMEGALDASGWHGKEFRDAESVHPLLYYKNKKRTQLFALNPALATFHPIELNLMKSKIAHLIVRLVRPIVQTKRFTARLRMLAFRGVSTATMVYDKQPINDAFRKLDENTVLGVMDMRGMDQYYFFLLRRQ